MLRVWTDFNARTANELCWILVYRNADLGNQIDELGLVRGDKILLFQDDDFQVEAALDFLYVDMQAREMWVAIPDCSTFIRK